MFQRLKTGEATAQATSWFAHARWGQAQTSDFCKRRLGSKQAFAHLHAYSPVTGCSFRFYSPYLRAWLFHPTKVGLGLFDAWCYHRDTRIMRETGAVAGD